MTTMKLQIQCIFWSVMFLNEVLFITLASLNRITYCENLTAQKNLYTTGDMILTVV